MNRKNQILILCKWLTAWRKSRNLTQEQVKFATGIDLSNYETGRCKPGLHNLMMLCDFYDLPIPWLLKKVEEIELGQASFKDIIELARQTQDNKGKI
jgi:transcriptional regulator with XRE-family HTH domain